MRKLLPLFLLLGGLASAQYSPANYCADAGASDAYACNLSPSPIAYVTGTTYFFKANTANTGAATINYNGIGAITIVKVVGGITTALNDNDIRVGQIIEVSYDGTNMQMQSTLGNGAPSAYNTVQNNGTPLTQRTTLNCTGGTTCSDSGGVTVINSSAGTVAGSSITSTTPVTVSANTTSDQKLMELALTAGYLNSLNQPFMFNGAGLFSTPIGQTPTLTFKIKLCTISGCGSGTVVTLISIVTTATLASSTNNNWNYSVMGYTAATGATGNLEIHGPLSVDLGALTTTADSIFNDVNTAVSSNIDLTAALFVDFTVATSTGSASNSITQRQGGVMPFTATTSSSSGLLSGAAFTPVNSASGTSSSWQNYTFFARFSGSGFYQFPTSWKVRMRFTGGSPAIGAMKILRTLTGSTSVIDSTTVQIGGVSNPTLTTPLLVDTDAISLATDSTHDYWFAMFLTNVAGNAGVSVSAGTSPSPTGAININGFVTGYVSGSDQTGATTIPTISVATTPPILFVSAIIP